MARTHRDTAFESLVRACATFVRACATLVEAIALRIHEDAAKRRPGLVERRDVAEQAPVAASPRLVEVPSEPEDLLPAALKRLGFKDAEVREMSRHAQGATLGERIQSALASRRSA